MARATAPTAVPDSGKLRRVLSRPHPNYIAFQLQSLPARQLLAALITDASQPRSHLQGAASFGRGSWLTNELLETGQTHPSNTLRTCCGAVFTAETLSPDLLSNPPATAAPEARFVGPLGLRVRAKKGLLLGHSPEPHYRMLRAKPQGREPRII
ncbi:hypothetical protein MRX96_052382 [Rhipicephalus microplus]